MSPQDLAIAQTFKRLILQKVKIGRVLVFGSRSRGDATEESDLDLLVEIEEKKPGMRKWISECAWEAGFAAGVVIAPVVYTKDELTNHPGRFSCFVQKVLKEGISV
ncbi:MAG: nucleotidyltransferase domain-containing protein [Candidatus Schekmanbacteria bacterium]|nr:nucleotidyltransferase domain-containing protein [Candidatus Schekmanbacteria bacterium]